MKRIIVVILVLMFGCFFSSEPAFGAGKRGVQVFGDSISALSLAWIKPTLRRYAPTYHVTSGTSMTSWETTIQTTVETEEPQDWIVELGTNDTGWNPGALDDYSTAIAQELALLQNQACVILVTVNPDINAEAAQLHAVQLTVTRPPFHILDWGDIEWEHPKVWLRSDDVHPSKKGSAILASLYREALRDDCSRQ
jgi:lysophospholipase L1-like esterase